jgi:hypothetical protein
MPPYNAVLTFATSAWLATLHTRVLGEIELRTRSDRVMTMMASTENLLLGMGIEHVARVRNLQTYFVGTQERLDGPWRYF